MLRASLAVYQVETIKTWGFPSFTRIRHNWHLQSVPGSSLLSTFSSAVAQSEIEDPAPAVRRAGGGLRAAFHFRPLQRCLPLQPHSSLMKTEGGGNEREPAVPEPPSGTLLSGPAIPAAWEGVIIRLLTI